METNLLSLTQFHARPGVAVDRSQVAPVKLTKHDRPYAVVVSAEWFDRAERALADQHGNRRVLDASDVSNEDLLFLRTYGPAPAEIESDEWRN